jgi:tetratricopeptide (TPR) repeat protein
MLNVMMICMTLFLISCKSTPTTTDSVVNESSTELKVEEPKFVKRYDDNAINMIIHTAWEHLAASRVEPALLDFERLITKGYSHYDVLFGAGVASVKFYDLKKAVRYFTLCLKQRPDHFEALYSRAEVYRQLKMFPQARADLEYLLANDPASPIICGLYPKEYADKKALQRRRDEAASLLRTL